MAANVFTRRVKEKKAEKAVNQWYDPQFPALRTKMNLQGRRGWPDQCYWIPGGSPFLIEFKADDAEPGTLQTFIHESLKKNGYDIEVHTDAAEAISSLKRRIAEGRSGLAPRSPGDKAVLGAAKLAPAFGKEVAVEAIRRGDEALVKFKRSLDDLSAAVDRHAGGAAAGPRRARPKAEAAKVEPAQVPGPGGEVRRRARRRGTLP